MDSEKENFLKKYGVSYGTREKLVVYETMLRSWNEKFNLVAPSTLSHVWSRHFLDSAQLMPFIPKEAETLVDMGAGAGFPGLVLDIMAEEAGRSFSVHSVESIGKKADFLRAVVKELDLKATVHQTRIEAIKDLKADVVTARALKALPELLVYANRLIKKDSFCLFLKGKSVTEELTQAEKYWTFKAKLHPSQSDPSGKVLVLSQLRYKNKR